MLFYENVEIKNIGKLASDIYEMYICAPEVAKNAKPGQFVNIYINDESKLLPRPISICEVSGDELRIVYRTAGSGTKAMSSYKVGDRINITGPVGNGYDVEKINNTYKEVVLFGGGIGIPPMLELAKRIKVKKTIIVGYRDQLFLNEDLSKYGDVVISTDDGSCGIQGNVVDAFKTIDISPDAFFGCGPMVMLRALKKTAEDLNIDCFISLEERMACGVGVCLGCVCKTKEKHEHSQVNNARVCVDGPVFEAREVDI